MIMEGIKLVINIEIVDTVINLARKRRLYERIYTEKNSLMVELKSEIGEKIVIRMNGSNIRILRKNYWII